MAASGVHAPPLTAGTQGDAADFQFLNYQQLLLARRAPGLLAARRVRVLQLPPRTTALPARHRVPVVRRLSPAARRLVVVYERPDRGVPRVVSGLLRFSWLGGRHERHPLAAWGASSYCYP
eukprot:4665684-Prymnesium_polylepis.1